MKSDPKIIESLNSLLADELTAINQYMVHSEMCDNWGYERLHKDFEARAFQEMKHAESLIGRILFLEGRPIVSVLRPINIGQTVPEQLANDLSLETGAVKAYNDAIKLCAELGDHATRDFLQNILNDEDAHIDNIEEKQDQISQTGVQIFLGQQMKKGE